MYFKDKENKLHWLDDAKHIDLLPKGCVEITDEEADKIRFDSIQELSLEDMAENVRLALQAAIDDKAKSFGFSGGDSIIQYAGFANKWQSFALVFANWEVQIWDEADAYKAEVFEGTKPMLSPSEAVALMPVYPS